MEHTGKVVPRASILTQFWGALPDARTLGTHIGRLRRKLGIYADQYIETVHGVGYRFRPPQGFRAMRRVAGRVSSPPGTKSLIMAQSHTTSPAAIRRFWPSPDSSPDGIRAAIGAWA